jgi:hypothetical protein
LNEPDTIEAKPNHRGLWTALALIVLLLLLALTPPLLNVNRLQRRIVTSMSEALGRPVHLDNATLHLLPVPGFTLDNLVINEDPAFGFEPIIRATTVEITLRPSSLWRRQVELSSIRFVDPSLNLVRNSEGHWNLQSLLTHASQVSTAPTAQQKAGPAPRFPYIEATGARVNLKLGNEKQPFSLTDADFALWLPSPDHWRVRLEGKPARTDTTIFDPGTVRLEGSLQRAANMADVPVDLHASWHDAPLGEASKLLTGTDAGWRGALTLETTLTGKLGDAKLKTVATLNDVRRAGFVPPRLLDLKIDCTGILAVPSAILHNPACTLPEQSLSAVAETLNLSTLNTDSLRIGSPGVAESWLLDWARMFSQRIPASASLSGHASGSLLLTPAEGTKPASWQGEIQADFPSNADDRTSVPKISILTGSEGAVLAPVNLFPNAKSAPLFLSGTATTSDYTLHLDGTATPQQLTSLRALAPPLADNLDQAIPAPATDLTKSLKIDVTCTRLWTTGQTCTTNTPTPPSKHHLHHKPRA